MDLIIIPVVLVLLVWTETILFPPKPKEKSVEEQLGEALGRYLAKGININVHMKDK